LLAAFARKKKKWGKLEVGAQYHQKPVEITKKKISRQC